MAIAILRPFRPAPRRTGTPPTWLRGTNYLASTALGLDNTLCMLPALPVATRLGGYYWGPYVEQEIAEIARAGLNNVRIHTASFLGWMLDPDAYMRSLAHLARTCAKHEVTITYQFWTSTGGAHNAGEEDVTWWFLRLGWTPRQVHAYIQGMVARATLAALPLPAGEPGHWVQIPEPGPKMTRKWSRMSPLWKKLMMDYVATIADFFANTEVGRAAFGSYDLFNEPDVYDRDAKTGDAALQTAALPLILDTDATLARVHPNAERTFGLASVLDQPRRQMASTTQYLRLWLSRLGSQQAVTYLSCHADVSSMSAQLALAALVPSRLPMVVSEFWHTLRSLNQVGQFRTLKDQIGNAGAGGQMWGYLESNVFELWKPVVKTSIDGVVKPMLPTSRQLSAPLSFRLNYSVDHAAVLDWTSKKPTRRY